MGAGKPAPKEVSYPKAAGGDPRRLMHIEPLRRVFPAPVERGTMRIHTAALLSFLVAGAVGITSVAAAQPSPESLHATSTKQWVKINKKVTRTDHWGEQDEGRNGPWESSVYRNDVTWFKVGVPKGCSRLGLSVTLSESSNFDDSPVRVGVDPQQP